MNPLLAEAFVKRDRMISAEPYGNPSRTLQSRNVFRDGGAPLRGMVEWCSSLNWGKISILDKDIGKRLPNQPSETNV
jgi:hypothetical protein